MKIIIPGNPVPQARMKHSNARGFVTTYDPKAKEKKIIREILQCKAALQSFEFPRITFLFHMPIPASTPKKDLGLYKAGIYKHTKKPDVDNLVKLYLDCLDGIVIHGDQKVSLGPCIKVYHEEPKTTIWIQETTHRLEPWELDIAFLDATISDIPSFCTPNFLCDACSLPLNVSAVFDSFEGVNSFDGHMHSKTT